jgi:hypothetical protein
MVWQIPTEDRPKLLSTVRRFFASNGWTVKDVSDDNRTDLLIKNRDMLYFVTVVDEAQKRFFRFEKMIEGMSHDAYQITGFKRRTLVYILNFKFPSLPFDTLAEQGIAVFSLDEMGIVAGSASYQDELPPTLGVREMLLFRGNAKVCIAICKKFQALGDRAAAIRWGEQAIKLRGGVSVAHTLLFHLYVEENDPESAQRVAEEVFSFQPKNVHFLTLVEKLAIKRNDLEAAKSYREKRRHIEEEGAPARSLDDLLKRQREKRAASGDSSVSSPVVEKKTGLAQLLERFRRS